MFCGGCGNQIPTDAKFCNRCGARQVAPVAQAPVAQVQAQVTLAPKRRSKALWIVLATMVVGGGVAAVLIVRGGGASGPPRPRPVVGKPDTENLPPQVKGFVARDKALEPGGSTELTATIEDPERDPVHAWWSASCGIIAPRADAPTRAVFIAPPTPGPCAITLEVQDHELARTRRLHYTIVVAGG